MALGALVAGALSLLLPSPYSSSALVRAEWDAADEALLEQRGVDLAARRVQAVRQRVTDRELMARVLREALPPVAGASPDARLDRLLAELRVRPMASSSFVIEFTHPDAATAARVPSLIAHQLARADGASARTDGPSDALERELEEARRRLRQKAEELGRASAGLPKPQAGGPGEAGDESDPRSEEDVLAERRAVAAALATARSRAERLQLLIEAESRSDSPPTPRAELERRKGELAELRQRYTEEHPDVEKLRLEIARLEASVPEAGSELPSPQAELRATQGEIEQLSARIGELDTRRSPPPRAPERAPASGAGEKARQSARLEHEQAQQAYDAVLARWREAETAARANRGPITRFELLRDAAIPRSPQAPSPLLFALAGALAGLLVGLLAAVVAESRDRSVKGPEDLDDLLPAPLLAIVPEARDRDPRA